MAYKLQHMGLGGILDQAFAIVKDHFRVLLSIMLLTVIPFGLIQGLLTLAVEPQLPQNPTVEDIRRANQPDAAIVLVFAGFTLINGLILTPIANAAVIHTVANLYLGRSISAVVALKHGLKRLLPLLGTTILMGLANMAGFILCVVPMFVFMVWFALSQHVVVIEGLSGSAALKRSKQLVSPNWLTLVVLYLILIPIAIAIWFTAYFIPERHVQVLVSPILQAGATIVTTAAFVVYYFSCRCAVENFDLEYLAQSIESEPQVDEFGITRS